MEFGFVIFLLSSTLLGHSSGFTTDYEPTTDAEITTALLGPVGSCSGHFTERAGEFASPQYPNRYPHYAHCTWRIQSLERKFIILRFLYVDIEASTGCRYDAVHVYDGPSASSPLLGSVCGSQKRSFSSSGNNLTVVFASDNTGNGGGFVAQWVFTDTPETTPPPPAATTTTLDITTGHYSCRYNCGYNLGVCSCSSSCQYYGNCCHDYYDYCFPRTTESSLTTVYISCRDRCGYSGAVCSCTSSCQYYGNCCDDYYDYCFPRTTESSVTADYISCRDRCGYSGAVCSCTSSCQYYGNCCNDYQRYCSPTTPDYGWTTEDIWGTTAAPCGGNLIQSQGEFFSPNYPYNYPNNARCTWTLLGGELQVVSLTFTSVDLESCCDHIYVYDGPNTQHTLLGSVTGNQTQFNSSNRYMTVLFSTDGSVTRRGFRAEWTFKYAPMCKDQCGFSNSRCSCESSCEQYGRCCHDYYDYCYYTTSAPLPACGGRLYGSGSISSPYYPSYYHDNAQCVWQLSAPPGQTIFLSFHDFDLERCCNCDYVNVYDGPSTASHLIEKLCHNNTTHLDFQSSSSYMTVLFRSDYSGVGRGFKAYFSSSLNSNTGHVDCSSDWMNIAIRKSYLDSLGFNWYDLYLDDHRCRASADYYNVTFNFPLHSCSTRRKTENGRIIYTNNVRAAQSTSGEITRHDTHFLMRVNCVMERDSSVGTLYEAKEILNGTITGTGRFNTTMAFYPSSSFYYPITESPYRVDLNQQLYVQVQLTRAEPSLHLFIDSCVASPNHDFSIRTYDLIRNGCKRDSTVTIYRNGDRYFAQFSFRAFKFLRTHNQVFLRCDVIICADNDYNSRCRQGCRYRRKRSLSSDHHTAVVTLGPITQKDPEEAVAKTEDKE